VAVPTFAATEVIPVPPTKVTVSVNRANAEVPVSPAMFKVVAREAVEAAVRRPFASTVNIGIAVADP